MNENCSVQELMDNKLKIDLKGIINLEGDNKYENINSLKNKYGVYFFKGKNTFYYIGAAHTQDLYTRVKQHLVKRDSGGRFRINYMNDNNCDFNEYKEFIEKECTFYYIVLERNKTNILKFETLLKEGYDAIYTKA